MLCQPVEAPYLASYFSNRTAVVTNSEGDCADWGNEYMDTVIWLRGEGLVGARLLMRVTFIVKSDMLESQFPPLSQWGVITTPASSDLCLFSHSLMYPFFE